MNFKKINNITGWAVCIIACIVYLLTMEATISFWDTGEFATGAYKLEVVHAPGAPLFILIGRVFMFLLGAFVSNATAINSLSALSSGFTILFLFWTITHFGKRIVLIRYGALNQKNTLAIMAAGVVGALAYTFSDTFWFSAVEAEVYAMSSFLTALVFWAILKWEDKLSDGDVHADRWIVFIAFILGLSIGVHLLNLLTIPAIVMVYYFKKNKNITPMGTAIAFVVGCILTGVAQYFVIQKIPWLCAKFDVLFVNDMGLPFNSGVYFVILFIAVLSFFLLRYAQRSGKYFLHLGTLVFLFMVIGYSSYFQTVIRSSADVPIDMTNPDNAQSLVSYLSREQYGSIPHLTGPDFTSQITDVKEGEMRYYKGKDKYEEIGPSRTDYVYDETRVFPRVWDANDPRHVSFYQTYLGLNQGEKPSGGDNIRFFLDYQVNQMWWRYFCWNYIGRQNDYQNLFGEADNGNWLSGVKFIDKMFGRGDADKMPEGFKHSKGRNELYFLPFILGIIGLIYQIRNDKQNAFVVGLLFFFTGLAIVIYLNNTPLQPRERDYAFAGATYAFAIWIGLGVMMVEEWFGKFLKGGNMSVFASGLLCLLAVPVLMAAKEWDDHDRSNKTLPMDTAENYLMSLDKNAILFTEGDNDTYPLWYAQEVEHVRPDVRIINLSLLGIDWYVDQLRKAVNESTPVKMVWNPEDYRGDKLNYVRYQAAPGIDQAQYYDLSEVIRVITKNTNPMGLAPLPVKNVSIPVNKANIVQSGILEGRDSIIAGLDSVIRFTLPKETPYRNDLAVMNILAANHWERPIYFANSIDPDHYEGLGEYLELEGLVYKLVPYRTPGSSHQNPLTFNEKKCVDWYLNKVKFGGAQTGKVYFDEPNRRMLNGLRLAAKQISDNLIARGKKETAVKILDHAMANIKASSYSYNIQQTDITMLYFADAYMKAGAEKKALDLVTKLVQFVKDDLRYAQTLKGGRKQMKEQDLQFYMTTLNFLNQSAQQNNAKTVVEFMSKSIQELAPQIPVPQQPQIPQR